ncbi:MAG: DUF1615 domain-containing protein [Burkholderiaceae bacterium]|nr:DUF1615 domain-containing protein [Burkholderiaceae bacterium]
MRCTARYRVPLPGALGRGLVACAAVALAACGSPTIVRERIEPPEIVRARVREMIPDRVADRAAWAADIESAFRALRLPMDDSHLCAAVAVIAQESSFQADPRVPDLGRLARREVMRRAERLHVPALAVEVALRVPSRDGRSYGARLDAVRTERELSALYEELIDSVPLGRRLLADYNPVRTGGPMQVGVAFAEQQVREHPYPYPLETTVRQAVFTRRGGLYFGIAHLLDYPADYDAMRYRFADFNAGRYASRNAAFQQAVAIASGRRLALDGDLVRYGALARSAPGETESAVRSLAGELDMTPAAIRTELEQGNSAAFSRTALHAKVFVLAERRHGRRLPRAILPGIALKSPKITRNLTTAWFAKRVEARHVQCRKRASGAP